MNFEAITARHARRLFLWLIVAGSVLCLSAVGCRVYQVTRQGSLFHYQREHLSLWRVERDIMPFDVRDPDGNMCWPKGTAIYTVESSEYPIDGLSGKFRMQLGQDTSLEGAVIRAVLGYAEAT